MIQVRLDRYVNRHTGKAKRLIWEIIWRVLGATTPRWMLQGWRRWLINIAGGKLAKGVQVHGGARIWTPRNLEIGEHSWVGDRANLYCVNKIKIGAHAVVSEGSFICTAEHDITNPRFELKTAPIVIGDNAWVGARATVLPGVTIGEGAVVAAGAIVTKDVAPWTVVAGNPAREIKKRVVKNPQSDISVVILTKDEKLHIGRCLQKLEELNPREVVVVDCGSKDGTVEAVEKIGASEPWKGRVFAVHHDWPGTQAAQFNWALDNLRFGSGWILRLDADEYLTEELVEEIKAGLPIDGCNGFILKRRHVVGWLGDKWVKRGMYPTKILRLFRKGTGKSNLREMDEYIDVEGVTRMLTCDFVDHSLITFEEWREKHRAYAKREAKQWATGEWGNKAKYYRAPLYLRAIIYWAWRMFRKGAIFEGPKAWRWCWYHALWYRWQCDREIGKLQKAKA